MPLVLIPVAIGAAAAVVRAVTRRKRPGSYAGGLVRIGVDADDESESGVSEAELRERGLQAPREVTLIMRKLEAGEATSADVRHAAVIAEAAGSTRLAHSLRERAEALEAIDELLAAPPVLVAGGSSSPAQAQPANDGGNLRSPIAEASDEQWTRFVEALATGEEGKVNSNGTLGRWLIDYRQLRDLGIVTEVAKRADGKGYTGTWKRINGIESGDPEKEFLADEAAQYMALVQICLHHYAAVIEEWSGQIGGHLGDRVPITLSGLLGVARKTGLSGLGSWLANESDRKKFTLTTECFNRCNGIF